MRGTQPFTKKEMHLLMAYLIINYMRNFLSNGRILKDMLIKKVLPKFFFQHSNQKFKFSHRFGIGSA